MTLKSTRAKYAWATAFIAGSLAMAQDNNRDARAAGEDHGVIHEMSPLGPGDAPPVGSTGSVTPRITYHNGSLIGTPSIYYIFYGNWNQANSSDTAAGVQILKDFAGSIGGSPYFGINKTYSTSLYNITGNAVFGGSTTDAYSRGTRLRDSDVLAVVSGAITGGKLPYDANGVYFVLSSSDVSETSGFCTQYCGWHTSGNTSRGKVRYSFVGNANRCLNSCAVQTVSPNNNPGVDAMISVLAHELEESVTDPDPASGWVDTKGAENADKCAWTFGTTTQLPNGSYYNVTLGNRKYLIQRNLKVGSTADFCVMQ